MSKTLSEIIESCKDGERPEYDELRFAVLALSHIQSFNFQDMLKVYQKSPDEPFGLKRIAEESFNRTKRVMAVPPKEYLGDNWNPDKPEYQKQRKVMRRLANKIFDS
jgi:hypothetical protein